jgi:hypothetical protein
MDWTNSGVSSLDSIQYWTDYWIATSLSFFFVKIISQIFLIKALVKPVSSLWKGSKQSPAKHAPRDFHHSPKARAEGICGFSTLEHNQLYYNCVNIVSSLTDWVSYKVISILITQSPR